MNDQIFHLHIHFDWHPRVDGLYFLDLGDRILLEKDLEKEEVLRTQGKQRG